MGDGETVDVAAIAGGVLVPSQTTASNKLSGPPRNTRVTGNTRGRCLRGLRLVGGSA